MYGELFNNTSNVNKSNCMVIESKPQEMKNIHCVNLNNRPLLYYTTKYKYMSHIINHNLTDDDDIAIQKRCLYAQVNVLAQTFCLCSPSTKII